jgi:hypothetical protein
MTHFQIYPVTSGRWIAQYIDADVFVVARTRRRARQWCNAMAKRLGTEARVVLAPMNALPVAGESH